MVSAIIASRNEPYLNKTIQDLLSKASGTIEIIVILDGAWEQPEKIINDKRVVYVHFTNSRGLRNAINCGVAIARGEYILKTDAHCLFDTGYDTKLTADCQDNWIVVPRRKRLDPEKWEIIEDGRPPIDYEYLAYPNTRRGLYGIRWVEKGEERKDVLIDDIISAQGSCYFFRKKYFNELGGMDEVNYGQFFLEFQEIALKVWLSGGRVVVNKKTYYCHWHKVSGRGYHLPEELRDKAVKFMNKWLTNSAWDKQKLPFSWLIKKFQPMPGWENYPVAK